MLFFGRISKQFHSHHRGVAEGRDSDVPCYLIRLHRGSALTARVDLPLSCYFWEQKSIFRFKEPLLWL